MVSHKISQRRKATFLAAFRECGCVSRSAEIAKVDRRSHYDWLESDPEYSAAFEDAKEQATDALEREARRRAVEGCRRYKFHQGLPVLMRCEPYDPEGFITQGNQGEEVWVKHYYELEYSDSLLTTLLKANNRAKFGDSSNLRLDGQLNTAGQVTIYLPDNGRDGGERK